MCNQEKKRRKDDDEQQHTCLLYTSIHTVVFFVVGSSSIAATNANISFAIDVCLMGIVATVVYSYLFKKTKYNVLYVLLVGTVLTSFFGSIRSIVL